MTVKPTFRKVTEPGAYDGEYDVLVNGTLIGTVYKGEAGPGYWDAWRAAGKNGVRLGGVFHTDSRRSAAHTWGDPVNVLDRYTPPETPPTITTPEEAAARLAWLDEALDSFAEWWSETYGQYRAEVAMYGDAWPGSAVELADAREEASRWEAERKALIETWSAPAPPPEPPAPWTPTDEEPF